MSRRIVWVVAFLMISTVLMFPARADVESASAPEPTQVTALLSSLAGENAKEAQSKIREILTAPMWSGGSGLLDPASSSSSVKIGLVVFALGGSTIGDLDGDGKDDVIVYVPGTSSAPSRVEARGGVDGSLLWSHAAPEGGYTLLQRVEATGEGIPEVILYDVRASAQAVKPYGFVGGGYEQEWEQALTIVSSTDASPIWSTTVIGRVSWKSYTAFAIRRVESSASGLIAGIRVIDALDEGNGQEITIRSVGWSRVDNMTILGNWSEGEFNSTLSALDGATGMSLAAVQDSSSYEIPEQFPFLDVTGDGRPDLLTMTADWETYRRLRMIEFNGGTVWEKAVRSDYQSPYVYVSAAALSSSIQRDVLLYGSDEAALVALKGTDGSRLWRSNSRAYRYGSPADVDGDGSEDLIAWTNPTQDSIVFWILSGRTSTRIVGPDAYAPEAPPSGFETAWTYCLCGFSDLSGDGIGDLGVLSAFYNSDTSTFSYEHHMRDGATLEPIWTRRDPDIPLFLWADVDGDQGDDLYRISKLNIAPGVYRYEFEVMNGVTFAPVWTAISEQPESSAWARAIDVVGDPRAELLLSFSRPEGETIIRTTEAHSESGLLWSVEHVDS